MDREIFIAINIQDDLGLSVIYWVQTLQYVICFSSVLIELSNRSLQLCLDCVVSASSWQPSGLLACGDW